MALKPLFEKIGISDTALECECCGNTDLTKTIVLLHIPTNREVYFGSVCAAAAVHPWAALAGKYAGFVPRDSDDEGEE